MNYNKIGSLEIAKRIAYELNGTRLVGKFGLWGKSISNLTLRDFDPCNKWEDIGPIIEEYKIPIFPVVAMDASWIAGSDQRCKTHELNPKRAAAICFLKMMEQTK